MLLFNVIRLSSRRVMLLLAAALIAATAAFSISMSRSSTHSSTAIIFTSQLLRDNRTDGELQNLVDDLLLATELKAVTDAVEDSTGLAIDDDYTVLADRVVDDGDTIEITATSQSQADSEAAARAIGQASFDFIVGQDVAKSTVAQLSANIAVDEITAQLEQLDAAAGGISPVALHDQAQDSLALLITARGINEAPTADETELLARVSQLAGPRRQYLQLEALLANHQKIELDELQASYDADVALSSVGTDILVKNAEENSRLALVIQTMLLAVLATVGLTLGFFALSDRRVTTHRPAANGGQTPRPKVAQKPKPATDAAPKPAPTNSRAANTKPAKKTNGKSTAKRRSVPKQASNESPVATKGTQSDRSDRATSRVKANGSDREK